MKKLILFSLLLLLLGLDGSFAQMLQVFDKVNLEPLSGASVSSKNPSFSGYTDSKGKIDLLSFQGADSITISMFSYASKTYSLGELSKLGYKIHLPMDVYNLDEVVISINRFEEKKEEVPQEIQILKAKEMQFMNQPTTAELLQNTGNVLVQKSQMGGGSPIIRGFEANKVLMVVDGVRMNNAIYRGGHLQNVITIDNSILDRTEIVFGPGSVVYGSDALGGVLSFYTKNPVLADTQSKSVVKANAYTRYSSAYNEKTGHLDFSVGSKKIGSLTSFTYSDFGDLRQGNNRNPLYGDFGKRKFYSERINGKDSMVTNSDVNIQKQSAYHQYDILQKILFKQSKRVSHTLNFQYSHSSDIPRYDRLTEMSGAKLKFAEWFYGPQKRLFTSYQLSLLGASIYDKAFITLGYQKIQESRNSRNFGKDILKTQVEDLDLFSLNADFDKKIKKHDVRYGIEITHNKVNSEAHDNNIVTGASTITTPRYPDGGSVMRTFAGYITNSSELSSKFVLSEGIRYTNVYLNSKFKDKTFTPLEEVTQKNNALSGNIGLVFLPGKDWKFSVLGSTGFRAPNVDDMGKVFESGNGIFIVPNPELKPEYTYNGEVGISKLLVKRVKLEGTVFYTYLTNALTLGDGKFNGQDSINFNGTMSKVRTTINADKAFIYGFNASMLADVTDAFSIYSTINYTYGRIIAEPKNTPLDHIPPVFGKTSFNLTLKRFRGEFFVMYNGWKRIKDYRLNTEDNEKYATSPTLGMSSWMTLNLRASYNLNQFVQLQAGLENILDQNYRVYASGISAPGRNLVLTLRAKI